MSYFDYRINVSDGQKQKVAAACKKGEKATLEFSYQDLVSGKDKIALTKTQINNIEKAKKSHKGVRITLSCAQLKYNKTVEGGFLGALLGMASRFLPTIAKTVFPALGVGALSGLANAGVEKALGKGLYMKKVVLPSDSKGYGLYMKKGGIVYKFHSDGSGLYLKEVPMSNHFKGDGLYLKRGPQLEIVGKGLILGKNSPIAKIPILGDLLGWLL